MSTNVVNTTDDVDMVESDGEKVVTMMDVLQEQQDFEDDANAVLGASDEKNCTYSTGYIKRQAIYACITCCPDAKDDPDQRAGVCLACSIACHENHDLVELYTKRNFRCDCGNPKFKSHPCQFTPNKTEVNEDNVYNQNFSGLYCICHRPYPDPEATFEDEMIQCVICEDWLHSAHLEAIVPNSEQYSEMICKACMDKNDFLHDYSELAINVENGDVDILSIDAGNVVISSISCNGDNSLFDDDTSIKTDKLIKNDESLKDKNEPTPQITDIPCDSHHEENDMESTEIHTHKSIMNNENYTTKVDIIETTVNDKLNISKENINMIIKETKTEDEVTDTDPNSTEENIITRKQDAAVDNINTETELKYDNDTLEAATEELSQLNKDSECDAAQKVVPTSIQDETENILETKDNDDTEPKLHNINSENDTDRIEREIADVVTESKFNNDCENTKAEPDTNKNNDAESKLNDVVQDHTNIGPEIVNVNTEQKPNDVSEDNILRTDPEESSEAELTKLNDNSEDGTNRTDLETFQGDIESQLDNNDSEYNNPRMEPEIHDSNVPESKLIECKDDTQRSEDIPPEINMSKNNDKTETTNLTSVEPTETTEPSDQENMLANNFNLVPDIESKPSDVSQTNGDLLEINGGDESKLSSDNDSNIETPALMEGVAAVEEPKHTDHELIKSDTSKIYENGDCEIESSENLTEVTSSDNKRKHECSEESSPVKKQKIDPTDCKRPKGIKKVYKGATFWPSNFRQKLCTCNACLSVYKDLNVLFLTDPEDTVTFYEALGQERNGGTSSQYEKGLEALSSLDRIQQINAMTEYNKLRDKLLDYFKSFKDRKEVVKEEDIKAFFAGMKPRREPDGVYFCR